MYDHANPSPIPTNLWFCYWEIFGENVGACIAVLPQYMGNCNFQGCKSPPFSLPVVVGHYIDGSGHSSGSGRLSFLAICLAVTLVTHQ